MVGNFHEMHFHVFRESKTIPPHRKDFLTQTSVFLHLLKVVMEAISLRHNSCF